MRLNGRRILELKILVRNPGENCNKIMQKHLIQNVPSLCSVEPATIIKQTGTDQRVLPKAGNRSEIQKLSGVRKR
jgi:hypothetical protein